MLAGRLCCVSLMLIFIINLDIVTPLNSEPTLSPSQNDVASLHHAILSQLIPSGPTPEVDNAVTNFTATLSDNMTWADIDYQDASRSWWFAAEHLRRSLLMASSFVNQHSAHYNKSEVRVAADGAFKWWLDTDPQNQWWWMQIGVPRIVAKYLLLLPNEEFLAMAKIKQLNRTPLYNCTNNDACDGTWTGCNRVWGASVHILLGAIEGNATRLGLAYKMAHSAIQVVSPTAEGGIQQDGSFHQHGAQLYLGWGYGGIFSTNVLVLEGYAAGTQWAMEASTWDVFSRLVLDGQAVATRGANFDFLACGRLFTYFKADDAFGVDQGHYHYFAAFSPFELAFPTFEPPFTTPIGVFFAPLLETVDAARPRASEFSEMNARLNGSSPDVVRHVHYYDSDYTAHHRPQFAVFIHMVSSRTLSTECVNSENKQGRMLADGATTIYSVGNQYESVFPLFNWTLLPGTTEFQVKSHESPDEECGAIRAGTMHNSFVGGLSDGEIGVTVMDFSRSLVSITTPAKDQLSLLECNISSKPQSGMHCDIEASTGILNLATDNVTGCQAACCANMKCSCFTFTTYERDDSSACQQGKPCCWLKESTAPLQPAVNCTGGQIMRPPTPPPPQAQACISAGKSWFLGDVVVAMGTNINLGSSCVNMDLPITTSIQQSNLLSDVLIGGSGSRSVLADNSRYLCAAGDPGCGWIWHNGLLHIVTMDSYKATDSTLYVSNEERTGSQFNITQGPTDLLSGKVFNAVLQHGTGHNLSYIYTIAPCANASDAEDVYKSVQNSTVVIANTKPVQSVCMEVNRSKVLQTVLWPTQQDVISVTGESSGCWNVVATGNKIGFLFQIRQIGSSDFEISVSVPTAVEQDQGLGNASLWIENLQLQGPGCSSSKTPDPGTRVTVAFNSTGATSMARCKISSEYLLKPQ